MQRTDCIVHYSDCSNMKELDPMICHFISKNFVASRCTTDCLHVSLRTVTFCHAVSRSARFITTHYVSHFRRDCRGRFLNCQKICHGVHGFPGVLRLPIPFPCVASRLSCFAHGCLKRGRRDRREHSVNAV